MDKELRTKIKEYLIDKPVLKAYIFGSEARNEATKDSDLDLLVELDYSKTIGLEFVSMQLDLQDMLNRKVDLVTEKSLSKYLKPSLDKDKILVYER